MFDLLGIKARKENKRLTMVAANWRYRANEAQEERDGYERALNIAQHANKAVRKLAEQLRQRIKDNGMTNAEKRFLEICRDIHKNGKMISPKRFNESLEAIEKDREHVMGAQ